MEVKKNQSIKIIVFTDTNFHLGSSKNLMGHLQRHNQRIYIYIIRMTEISKCR